MGLNYINRNLEDFNRYLYKRKIAIIGLDKSSIPIIDYFHRHNAKISVFDERPLDKLQINIVERIINYDMSYSLGDLSLRKLKNVDLIIKSPKYRYDLEEILSAEHCGAILTSVNELLIKLCPGKVIGIVGCYSESLISMICMALRSSGYNCLLDNDSCRPLLPRANEMNPKSVLIIQFDEKELLGMDYNPDILIIADVKKELDDSFMTYEEYTSSLTTISLRQIQEGGTLAVNADNNPILQYLPLGNENIIPYSTYQKLENGVIYDRGTIKISKDGLRKHYVTIDKKDLHMNNHISDICACIAGTMKLIEGQN